MNILPYKYFIYLTSVLGVLNIILPFALDSTGPFSTKISFIVIGLISLIISLISKEKDFPKVNILNPKLVLLGIFVFSIFQTFSPYLFSFTDRFNLVLVALLIPAANLAGILFTKFEEKNN